MCRRFVSAMNIVLCYKSNRVRRNVAKTCLAFPFSALVVAVQIRLTEGFFVRTSDPNRLNRGLFYLYSGMWSADKCIRLVQLLDR